LKKTMVEHEHFDAVHRASGWIIARHASILNILPAKRRAGPRASMSAKFPIIFGVSRADTAEQALAPLGRKRGPYWYRGRPAEAALKRATVHMAASAKWDPRLYFTSFFFKTN